MQAVGKKSFAICLMILLFTVFLLSGFYLLKANQYEGWGFPLDDAWIHQTYARNLVSDGEWAFVHGQKSGGSTSPLWTILLSGAYWLKLPYLNYTYFFGGISLFCLGVIGEVYLQKHAANRKKTFLPLTGLFLIGEWHLLWSSLSGMETIFCACLVLLALYLIKGENPAWFVVGILCGITIWIRPDGVTLLGPVLFTLWFYTTSWHKRFNLSLRVFSGFVIILGAYLVFNLVTAGSILPNTFYAKQKEYEIYQEISIFWRYLSMLKLPVVGAGFLLLPGFVYYVFCSIKQRNWIDLAAPIWLLGFLLLYAIRLPVVYQYGRYIMPAMPVYFVVGLLGVARLQEVFIDKAIYKRIVSPVWLLSIVLVWGVFLIRGAEIYGRDVAIINTEMVTSAKWIAENTEDNALIAAHDIGALGYFGEREIVDLAGLVSPEVIPYLRDEISLRKILDERSVDYLMTFPSWYSDLTSFAEPVFSTGGVYAPAIGGENMVVYKWFALP